MTAVVKTGKNYEAVPLAAALFVFIQLTSLVIVQFRYLEINSAVLLGFAYLLTALGSVIYGFMKRFSYVRIFGLGLIIITLAKLFLWDLRYLSAGGKIVAYAGFGIMLVGISFVYRKIKIMMEDENEIFKN